MVSAIIAKANGRNKVVDFRDGLVPALVEDYAMMHGAGGKGHAPASVIKVTICDFSAGTGDKSTTVSANISPDLCEQLLEVCRQNMGTYVVDNQFPVFAEQRATNIKLRKAADMGFSILQNVVTFLGRFTGAAEKGEMPTSDKSALMLEKLLGKTMDRAMATEPPQTQPACLTMARHMDYSYSQDRVHNYAGSDFAPVQRLTISHATYRRDGALSNYPWTIKIVNGRAKVRVQSTGATTFDASTLTDIKEAYIQVSDTDMFHMMNRVTHYIVAWESLVTVPVIEQGLAQKEIERQKRLADQKVG